MANWNVLKIDREHLGMLTGTGYYVALSGKNYIGWYIISPLKLIHLDESKDYFELVTKPDFEYRGVKLARNEKSYLIPEEKKKIYGDEVIAFFNDGEERWN